MIRNNNNNNDNDNNNDNTNNDNDNDNDNGNSSCAVVERKKPMCRAKIAHGDGKQAEGEADRQMPASVKQALLRIRRQIGESALKAPNLVLDYSFCCWVAGPRPT